MSWAGREWDFVTVVTGCAVGEVDVDKIGVLREHEGVEHQVESVAINMEDL